MPTGRCVDCGYLARWQFNYEVSVTLSETARLLYDQDGDCVHDTQRR